MKNKLEGVVLVPVLLVLSICACSNNVGADYVGESLYEFLLQYFRPINETDVKLLRNMDARGAGLEEYDPAVRIPQLNFLKRNDDWDTMSVSSDGNNGSQAGKRLKKKRNTVEQDSDDTDPAKDEVEDLQQRLNAYPYTHRLMAALVDEGGGKAVRTCTKKGRMSFLLPAIWLI
mmetsp:Transcript_10430/g.43423  ORF Transcript_10430/g.43423 Transcript_10430/m.43423 type:complete len:174 (+) Transcript_10430:890-1411(+)